MSVTHENGKCVLYTSDPRTLLNSSSVIQSTNKRFQFRAVREEIQVPFFVGRVETFSETAIQKCGVEQKITGLITTSGPLHCFFFN